MSLSGKIDSANGAGGRFNRQAYFLCGIGGSGMSALARILTRGGGRVLGSDRLFDSGGGEGIRKQLASDGVAIHPQDGSGVVAMGTGRLVVSSAVEATVPDVKTALDLSIPVVKRAQVLAERFNQQWGAAIGGTSGKSTVTAMLGHILREKGCRPTVVNGGVMLNSQADDGLGNAWCGDSDKWVVEADESDASIEYYRPKIAVLTTVAEDHLPLPRLRKLFAEFVARAPHGAVVNLDCQEAAQLATINRRTCAFGIDAERAEVCATALRPRPDGIDFTVDGRAFSLKTPGRHNVSNALAAIAAAKLFGLSVADCAAALAGFRGVRRRLQVLGTTAGGVTVVDDFAHNPEKIAASLATLREFGGRLLVFYQPHGFGPTKMLRQGLVKAFASGLSKTDVLLMPEIYFAGGTVRRDISSRDLLNDVAAAGIATRHCPSRDAARAWFAAFATSGDRIVVMGARDDSLSDLARDLFANG